MTLVVIGMTLVAVGVSRNHVILNEVKVLIGV